MSMRMICLLLLPLLALQAFTTTTATNTTLLAMFSCDDSYYCQNRTSYLVQLDPSTGQYVKGYNVSIDVNVHYPGPYTYNSQNDAFCFSMENDVNRSAPPVIYATSLKTNHTRSIEVHCGNNCWRFVSLGSYSNEVFGVVYPERYLNNFTFVRVDLTTNKSLSIPISLSNDSHYGTAYGIGVSHVFLEGVPYVIFLTSNTKLKSTSLMKINLLNNTVTDSLFTIPYCTTFQAYSSESSNTMFYCTNDLALYLIDLNHPDRYKQLYSAAGQSGFSVGGALDVENKKFYTTFAGFDKAYKIYTYDIQTGKSYSVSSPLDNNVHGLSIYRSNEK